MPLPRVYCDAELTIYTAGVFHIIQNVHRLHFRNSVGGKHFDRVSSYIISQGVFAGVDFMSPLGVVC